MSSYLFGVLVDALEYVHKKLKLVHRDVKLENILVVKQPNQVISAMSLRASY